LLLSPAAGLFLREEEHAQVMIKLLKEAVRRHGIRVRILTSKDTQEQIEKLIARERSQEEEKEQGRVVVGVGQGKFQIHSQQQRLQTNLSTLIVDSKVSLVEELKAYHKNDNSNEALCLATYSNSESTVLTYISIFETLWNQTDIQNMR